MFPIEGGRWLVTLGSFFDEPAPEDLSAFLDFARSLPIPDIHKAIEQEQPLSSLVYHHFPGSLRFFRKVCGAGWSESGSVST